MAVLLGKRKRRAPLESGATKQNQSDDSADEDTARALFQRAFEAKFRPLEKIPEPISLSKKDNIQGNLENGADSDWSGFSQDEDEVMIVEHAAPKLTQQEDILISKKSFMSSKPPVSKNTVPSSRKTTKPQPTEDDNTEATNLKNDLDLQRLLKESHLLAPSASTPATTMEGAARLKALDLRLQSLGAKSSVLQQEKMPLSHRRGIVAKSASRETLRRTEAAENGVILERFQAVAKKSAQKRSAERGSGGPGIGKFRGGTLKLSSRDVARIQQDGRKKGSGARGKRGRGSGGGRGGKR